MILEKTGSIFESSAECLINQVNCVGIMGAGLALEFKRRYPDMFLRYKELCKSELRIGSVAFWRAPDSRLPLFVSFQQKTIGEPHRQSHILNHHYAHLSILHHSCSFNPLPFRRLDVDLED